MEKHKLIERETQGQIELLPVVYKKLQFESGEIAKNNIALKTINMKSIRHQSKNFAALRFYKNIEIFLI